MDKIENKFKELQEKKRKAFIVYIPFGFPTLSLSKKIIKTLDKSGVDMIELGIPFSDPLADGPIIQRACSLALKEGATPQLLLDCLKKLKNSIRTPIVILSYFNPIYRFGVKKFLKKCRESNVSGIMIVDLPLEEAKDYIREARQVDIDTIFFITPTTELVRAKRILESAKGFVYYISVTGITGPKEIFLKPLLTHLREIRKLSTLPICVGFGIHKKSQVRKIWEESDGVILGSIIVKFIERHYKEKEFLNRLSSFIKKFYV